MSKKRFTGNWESVKSHQIPKWYDDCKFGIFIHWGPYSVPAYAPHTWELGEVDSKEWFLDNPYAEWYYNSLNIGKGHTYDYHIEKYGKDFKYEDFIPMWKAEKWDPGKWAKLFKKAGAQYVVLTTKHHDGFCLYPSKYTDFNCAEMGPKRDITGELTDAVRAEGIRMGLYYSGLIDWQYANDPIFEDDDLFGTASPTFEYADYSYKQMMELVDTYKPSVFWNDIGWPKQSEEMMPYFLAHYYNKVEDGVVNDRFNGRFHDFLTKEYKQGKVDRSEKWEMCRGMGLSFGYNENEGDDQIISEKDMISLLVGTVANNGNLLINIGPKADGTIPEEQERRLLVLGKWLEINGEGIYGTRCSRRESIIMDNGTAVHFTAKGTDLYVFVDGLEEGTTEFDIPNIFGELTPLNKELRTEFEKTASGTRLMLENYRKDMYTLCFKAEGQE